MESVKTPQKTVVLRSMQTDTMGIYKKYLPLAMQTYLNTQGVGHNNVDNNFKQDMAMDLAELDQRELHGARADAEALAEADSFVLIPRMMYHESHLQAMNPSFSVYFYLYQG